MSQIVQVSALASTVTAVVSARPAAAAMSLAALAVIAEGTDASVTQEAATPPA
jgi:hypothetical protein